MVPSRTTIVGSVHLARFNGTDSASGVRDGWELRVYDRANRNIIVQVMIPNQLIGNLLSVRELDAFVHVYPASGETLGRREKTLRATYTLTAALARALLTQGDDQVNVTVRAYFAKAYPGWQCRSMTDFAEVLRRAPTEADGTKEVRATLYQYETAPEPIPTPTELLQRL